MDRKKVIFTSIVMIISILFSLNLYSKQLYSEVDKNYKVHGNPMSYIDDLTNKDIRIGARIAASKNISNLTKEEVGEDIYKETLSSIKKFKKDEEVLRRKVVLASLIERLRDPFVLFSLLSIVVLIKALDTCYKDSIAGYYVGVFFIILIITQICLFSTKGIVAEFYSGTTQEILENKGVLQIKDALIKIMLTPISS